MMKFIVFIRAPSLPFASDIGLTGNSLPHGFERMATAKWNPAGLAQKGESLTRKLALCNDVHCKIKSLVAEGSKHLQTGIYYLRKGPDKAVERTRAFETTQQFCEEAKGVAEENLRTTNKKLEGLMEEIGKAQQRIDTSRSNLSRLEEQVKEIAERVSNYEAELAQAQKSYNDLEGEIQNQKRKVRKRKKKAGLWGVASVIVAPIAPFALPITLGMGTGEMVSLDQANRKLGQLKDLRDEKQQGISQQRNLRDNAMKEEKKTTQELSSTEKELTSLRGQEDKLREIVKHLGEVTESLKKVTTHLGTLYGRTKCVTMQSRQIAKNPFASTEGLVANTGVLASEMYKVSAHLSLEFLDPNTVTDEKYACVLLGKIEALASDMDTHWC